MSAIEAVRGETIDVRVEVFDHDDEEVDLDGFTLVWRTSSGLKKSTAEATIETVGHVAHWRIQPAETLALPNRRTLHNHELKGTSPAGVTKRIVAGEFRLAATMIGEEVLGP